MVKHQKHAKIVKPIGGFFNRNEVALIGAPCDVIQSLAKRINENLKNLTIGFADAAHEKDGSNTSFSQTLTDKITHQEHKFFDENIEYNYKSLFNNLDLALINGNHFLAENQIIIINQKKKESLSKKLDRLKNVWFFILDEGEENLHEYLSDLNPLFSELPKVSINDIEEINKLIQNKITANTPPLKGLVLAGGKSQRMGFDKGNINYNGKPQREYLADLLDEFCIETFISTNEKIDSRYVLINDSFLNLGPYSGILSAFREDPNAAWVTVATDIPLLDKESLNFLIQNRNTSKLATCFHNPETNFPEPLITIWEPKAYPQLLKFLSIGYSCPRKVLINSEIEELNFDRPTVLKNANTPEEMELLKKSIKG